MTRRVPRVTTTHYAILDCLARTPFVRAEDLARELAVSDSQLYRHLRFLRTRRLLEVVTRPATSVARGSCHLYTLTSAGLRTLLGAPPAVFSAQARAQRMQHACWEVSERWLRSLLPRLDRFALGQRVIQDLVAQAPAFFAERGTPATVRWSALRDFRQRVPALPQEGWSSPAQVFADWLLVLRVLLPGRQQQEEQLYPLFLLLDHACLPPQVITQRLQALMQARQVLARAHPQARDSFSLVLIVLPAGQGHRARHWQRQAADLAHGSRLPLRGCLAALPAGTPHGRQQVAGQGWQLPWHWLHRYGPCGPIRSLLEAFPREAAPDAWMGPTHQQRFPARLLTPGVPDAGQARRQRSAQATPASVRSFGSLVSRARQLDLAHLSPRTVGLLGLTLGGSHYRLLELLLVHPFLSQSHLAAFLQMREVSVRHLLVHLRERDCVEAEDLLRDGTPRFRLSSHGLRLLALRHAVPLGSLATPELEYVSPFPISRQKGIQSLRRHASLTVHIATFFAHLAQAGAQDDDQRLRWWETGYAREQQYATLARPAWHWKQPHALGDYQAGDQRVRFWLAWHGDEDHFSQRVQRDLAGYADFIRSLEWRREGQVLPLLLVVCPDGVRERQMQRLAGALWAALHPRPLLLSTTCELLETAGPLAPIWQICQSEENGVGGEESERRCFFHLDLRPRSGGQP
ncbi:MAG TPA: hypothetical protein VFV38_18655 [Ktedonobacteraceae bacterium]|nr:hypothetical protein [Ktedonobacteraceae bacterium]